MNNVTLSIENQILALANTLYAMNREVIDVYQYYYGSTAHTLVDNLASNSTPATTGASGSYSKLDVLNGITIMDILQKFFGNQVVDTGGYLGICDTLRNSNSAAVSPLSNDVENIGARIKVVVLDVIQIDKDAANILGIYTSSYLSSIIGGIPASNVIFGSNLTQAKLTSAITLLQQYRRMLSNQSVTTGDYLATITNLVADS